MFNRFDRKLTQSRGWDVHRMSVTAVCLIGAMVLGVTVGCACSGGACTPKKSRALKPAANIPLVVAISDQGQITVQEKACELDQLDSRLSTLAAANKDRPLTVRSTSSARFDIVLQVMDAAQRAGFSQISMATSKTQSEL